MNQKTKSSFFILLVILITGCSNLKYLPPDEQLYTGASVNIEPRETVKRKDIRKQLESVIVPKPNAKILGLRAKLWFYNIAGKDAKKGIRKWMRTKLGEPPVLFSKVDPHLVSQLMKSKLDNLGYFKSRAEYEIKSKDKKASVQYIATVSAPYKYNEITYPQGTDSLSIAIRQEQKDALIYKGKQYNLEVLKDERARIDNKLKNKGYYFFNPDLLIFKADTSVGDRKINMLLSVKAETPPKALIDYKLNKIFVVPQYAVINPKRILLKDTLFEYGYYFIERVNNFSHKALSRYIRLKEGEKYSKLNHDRTVSRLMGMGVFSFVNVSYKDTIIDRQGLLNAKISMTQLLPKTLKIDFDIGSKSNNYTGPTVTANFTNRNLWKAGELLKLNVNGTYEMAFSGKEKGFTSWEIGAGIQLITPRFITPITIRDASAINIPKTKFDLQYKALHRVKYFDTDGINFMFGYIWKETLNKEYEVNPIAINYSKLRHTTAAFDSILLRNPYLKRSFEEQFTFGSTVMFTYNTLTGLPKRNQYYLNLLLDVSGNLASLAHRVFTGVKTTDERPYKILGSRYAQYSKLSTDFRYYNNFDKNNSLATRIMIGAGIPYGNSTVMPYSKQFFSGGANSVRAFLPRSLGPGTFNADTAKNSYFDQSGDIKLEANLEFRFGIISLLKGAVFTDAGNVWLVRKNQYLPGGEFKTSGFLKEIAVGAGVGIRLDLSFFLLRLDLGIPLRKPWLPEQDRWVINDIKLGNPGWRRDNLVFNIAVGYPF